MSKVSRQHPTFSFAHAQVFGVEDTGGIGSRAISLADAGGQMMCHSWSLVLSGAPRALHSSAKPSLWLQPEHGSVPRAPSVARELPGHTQASGRPKGCPGSLMS